MISWSSTENTELTELWAGYASSSSYGDLPPRVVEVLKWLVLDTLSTTLAANTLGVGIKELLSWARASGGRPEATLLGFGEKLPAVNAAMLNGAMAHALNFDDTTAVGSGHLGPLTFPIAFVCAELRGGASGKEMLASLAAGAELMSRLGVAITQAQGKFSESKPQPTQMPGYFAATVSGGRMLGFAPDQMHSALGLAFMQASGGRQPVLEGRPAKAIYAAFPNQGAMLSLLLTREGLLGDCQVFEGEAGFFPAYYGGQYHRPALTEGLGEEFYLTNVGFKPWPTTGVAHVFIEAAARLREEHGIRSQDVAGVGISGEPHIRTFCEPAQTRRNPKAPVEAEDSVLFATAKALVTGTVTLADLQPTPTGLFEPEAVRIANLIEYSVDESLGRSGVVEVVLRTGARHVARVDRPLGHRDRPLSDAQRREKFLSCAEHAGKAIPRAALEEVIGLVEGLEGVPDVRVFARLLSGE